MTIVLIDDDNDEMEYMKSAVEACYPLAACVIFHDCDSAILALKEMLFPPEYIFLDVNMKKMDGEECLTEIRLVVTLNESKVVMMSSSLRVYEQKQQRLIQKGAFAIAEKPDTLDGYGKMFSEIIDANTRKQ